MAFKRVLLSYIYGTVVSLGQQYNIGEKPTVILYTYINRHAGTPEKQRRQNSTSSNMAVIIYCYIGCGAEVTTLKREREDHGVDIFNIIQEVDVEQREVFVVVVFTLKTVLTSIQYPFSFLLFKAKKRISVVPPPSKKKKKKKKKKKVERKSQQLREKYDTGF